MVLFAPLGSSPRVRGTLGYKRELLPEQGIIPACAGNTVYTPSPNKMGWDHPRVCGEHHARTLRQQIAPGSSPRVRGTPCPSIVRPKIEGIIPACAGNTAPSRIASLSIRDHPRVCGEHRELLPISVVLLGIIPACAGNTGRERSPHARVRDHPRVCGEHCELLRTRAAGPGSSPRVRGTQHVVYRHHSLVGIIPACAGNTHLHAFIEDYCRDHPRVCGEHGDSRVIKRRGMGSSPRVRGTREFPVRIIAHNGIIPACAGNTASSCTSRTMRRDHPRVCGEHAASMILAAFALGSSPRVRGTPNRGENGRD